MTREEWLETRRGGIGGSDISAIAGMNPWRSPLAVYLDKRGEIEDGPDNERMYWGRQLEDVVARHFAEVNNVKIRRVKRILRHRKYDFFIANLDRTITRPKAVLEIKTGGLMQVDRWADGKLPAEYELQVRWYMMVTGISEAWAAALLGGQHYREAYIARDHEMEEYLIEIALDFWRMVQEGTPPDPTHTDTELIKAMYPRSKPITITLPDSTDHGRLVIAKTHLDIYKKEVAELENRIKASMGEAEEALLPDGDEPVFTWREHSRTTIDTKRLREEKPDIYEKYSRTTTLRTFRTRS